MREYLGAKPVIVDQTYPIMPGSRLFLRHQSTGEPALTFYDKALTQRACDPEIADARGVFRQLWVAPACPVLDILIRAQQYR